MRVNRDGLRKPNPRGGSHAEIGYSEADGRPKQVSLWGQPGPMRPLDRPFHEHACNDAINVYRLSLAGYGIEAEREALLKSEVKRWKRIVQPVYFPVQTMNTDPVDSFIQDCCTFIGERSTTTWRRDISSACTAADRGLWAFPVTAFSGLSADE